MELASIMKYFLLELRITDDYWLLMKLFRCPTVYPLLERYGRNENFRLRRCPNQIAMDVARVHELEIEEVLM